MSLEPLFNAPMPIQLHAFAAMAAFALGLVQFAAPKGTLPHRGFGYFWVGLMVFVAASSFWIHEIRMWRGFSLIHFLSIYVLISLPIAVRSARRHAVRAHKKTMAGIFVGGLVVAGALTFFPGRLMLDVLLGG